MYGTPGLVVSPATGDPFAPRWGEGAGQHKQTNNMNMRPGSVLHPAAPIKRENHPKSRDASVAHLPPSHLALLTWLCVANLPTWLHSASFVDLALFILLRLPSFGH